MTEKQNDLLKEIKQRNSKEKQPYENILKSYTKLFDSIFNVRIEVNELKNENNKLKQENINLLTLSNSNSSNTVSNEKMQLLEEKLNSCKDEMIQLQKSLVEQAQEIILLNKDIKKKNDELTFKDTKISEIESKFKELKEENNNLKNELANLKEIVRLCNDEKGGSDHEYKSLLEKYEKIKDDYEQTIQSSLKFRQEQIDLINKMNELESQNTKVKKELEKKTQIINNNANPNTNDNQLQNPVKFFTSLFKPVPAASNNMDDVYDIIDIDTKTLGGYGGLVSGSSHSFECHDGEVNSVQFYQNGRYFITGGGDRKIKVWDYKANQMNFITQLNGSNASIMSTDVNNESNLIAGSSFVNSCYLWSLNDTKYKTSTGDFREMAALTGHTGKVLGVKFLDDTKLVTGSYDRTLKIWDLHLKGCIKTLLVGSSCNHVVSYDSNTVISAHLDKKIRIWDTRSDQSQIEILLEGKVTSLDLSFGKDCLLACTKDDNLLQTIDMRTRNIVNTFSCEEFKLSCDWSKAIFSPDFEQQYIYAGTSEGNLIIWNRNTTKVEKILKEHNSAILSLAWHPQGQYLVTCDSKKRAVIWV